MTTIYVFRKAGTQTAFQLAQDVIADKIAEYQIQPEDEIWAAGEWSAVGDQPEFSDAFAAPAIRCPPPIEEPEVDLAPMIDCTFLLLLFFMITASYTRLKSLPSPKLKPDNQTAKVTRAQIEIRDILVDIDEHGKITVDGQPVVYDNEDQLPSRLKDAFDAAKKARGTATLTIIAHPKTRFRYRVHVISAAIQSGIEKMRDAVAAPPPRAASRS